MDFNWPQLERVVLVGAEGEAGDLRPWLVGHEHWSLLYSASSPATAIISWPRGVLAPTHAFSKPTSRAFAWVMAASANAQVIAPLARLNMAPISWCSRISTAFAPLLDVPPLAHAPGLSLRMSQIAVSPSDKPPTLRLLTGHLFSLPGGLQPSGPCVFQ